MSEPAKHPAQQPEGYQPKKPEMKLLEEAQDETVQNSQPERSRVLSGVPRIFADQSHNYMFDECMWSLMQALGEEARLDFPFFAAATGDLFTQLWVEPPWHYNDSLSNVCKDTLLPIRAAFVACGYDFDYISREYVQGDKLAYTRHIVDSIDRGIPVLTFGIVGPPICSIITGYAEGGALLTGWAQFAGEHPEGEPFETHTTPGAFYIRDGLDESYALIFPKEKSAQTDLAQAYRLILRSIPGWINVPNDVQKECDAAVAPNKIYFGKAAFEKWADTYADGGMFPDESVLEKAADTYMSCMVQIGTNMHHMPEFLRRAETLCPDMKKLIRQLRRRYAKLNAGLKGLTHFTGGFFFDAQKFLDEQFRAGLAKKIRKMGELYQEVWEA